MNRILDARSKISKINDGSLIPIEKIEFNYGLTSKEIYEAVGRGDLSKPEEYVKKEYYYDDEIEMLAVALAETDD